MRGERKNANKVLRKMLVSLNCIGRYTLLTLFSNMLLEMSSETEHEVRKDLL